MVSIENSGTSSVSFTNNVTGKMIVYPVALQLWLSKLSMSGAVSRPSRPEIPPRPSKAHKVRAIGKCKSNYSGMALFLRLSFGNGASVFCNTLDFRSLVMKVNGIYAHISDCPFLMTTTENQ